MHCLYPTACIATLIGDTTCIACIATLIDDTTCIACIATLIGDTTCIACIATLIDDTTCIACIAALIDRTALANTILERVLQQSQNMRNDGHATDGSINSQVQTAADATGRVAIHFEHSLVGLDVDNRTATFEAVAENSGTSSTAQEGRVTAQ
jgi:hypothetical protein